MRVDMYAFNHACSVSNIFKDNTSPSEIEVDRSPIRYKQGRRSFQKSARLSLTDDVRERRCSETETAI